MQFEHAPNMTNNNKYMRKLGNKNIASWVSQHIGLHKKKLSNLVFYTMTVWAVFVVGYSTRIMQFSTNFVEFDFGGLTIVEDRRRRSSPAAETIPVFYNLFIKEASDYDRVKRMVEEQFNELLPVHKPIYVTNIGVPFDFNDKNGTLRDGPLNTTRNPVELLGRYESATELVTLKRLWEYCREPDHLQKKVVYLHSKGSFTPSSENDRLRRFLTAGTLSGECTAMPEDTCNVCSSRVSPIPHPHVPGNMWLARCEYVRGLKNPETFEDDMNALEYSTSTVADACDGRNRYSAEHWILSHPAVRPCDLYVGQQFLWNYGGIPGVELFRSQMELSGFLRFGLHAYLKPGTCPFRSTLDLRVGEYRKLYGEDPPPDWWGYGFFPKAEEFDWFPYVGKRNFQQLPRDIQMTAMEWGFIQPLWDQYNGRKSLPTNSNLNYEAAEAAMRAAAHP